MAYINCYIQYL